MAQWGAAVVALAVFAGTVWFVLIRSEPASVISEAATQVAPSATNLVVRNSPLTTTLTNHFVSGAPLQQLRPLSVATESNFHQWTSANGRDTNVIRQLAHNDLEYQRMVEETARIQRRQLVYRKATAAAVIERARLTGQPVRQLTLPGFDGQEIQFEITSSDLKPSGQQGTFTGHVAGRADSLVTLAFKGGREAFTVVSPSDHLYLQAEPREPGEVIVKAIDPDTYAPVVCGTP